MTTDLEKENEMLRGLVLRLQEDKDIMYKNALELQDEVDYYKNIYEDIKSLVDDKADGYEVVLKVRDLL